MKRSLFFVIPLLLALTACASATPQAVTQSAIPTSTPGWISIKMTQSGGIMGLSRVIVVARDGHVKVTDERMAQTRSFNLSAEELEQLNTAIDAVINLTLPQLDLNCADCFVYMLELSFPPRSSIIQLSDVQLTASGYESLVTYLRGLMDAALQ